jgi:hypothetical protein
VQGAGNTGNLSSQFDSTAPFQVAVAGSGATLSSPGQSASNTPRSASYSSRTAAASSTDPFTPSISSIPSVPSFDAISGGRAAFQSKLDALQQALVQTAQSLRLKQLLHDLDSTHSASLRSANAAVERLKSEWSTAAEAMSAAQSRYESELVRARTTLTEKQRKLDRLHSASVARATKEAEAVARLELAEKAKKFEGVEKYNAEKLKLLEEQLRVQLKAQLLSDTRKSKAAEQTLQAKLEQLEQAGIRIMQEKEAQLEQVRSQLASSELRCKEAVQRAQTWERKWEKYSAEMKRKDEELATARVDLSHQQSENISLLSQLDRVRETALSTSRDLTGQASAMANRLLDATAEVEREKARGREREREVEREREQTRQQGKEMKHKHALELDAIQSRIATVLQKKDEQIAQLKQQVQIQTQKVKDIERELGAI